MSWASPSYRSAGAARVYQVSAYQPRIVFSHQAWSARPIASGVASFTAMQARLAFAGSARTGATDVTHPPARAISAASANHRFNRIQLLTEAVERVGERLREDENGKPLVFRDSLIENIRELVDVVPRLNIFADDDLAMLCREVKDKFAGIEPDALRPSGRFDPNLRRRVKRDADALTTQFAGYFAPAAENREAA